MTEGETVSKARYEHGPFDYAGTAEVAEYLGVSKQVVVNWRSRYKDFPPPVALLAMGPIFRLCETRDWYKAKLKEKKDDPDTGPV